MPKYNIYHCVHLGNPADLEQPRKYSGSVEADSLQDAYNRTQGNWNRSRSRSTSWGDIIQDDKGTCHFVDSINFVTLSNDIQLQPSSNARNIIEKV